MTTLDLVLATTTCLGAISGLYFGTRKSRTEDKAQHVNESSHLVKGYKELNNQLRGEVTRLRNEVGDMHVVVDKCQERILKLERQEQQCAKQLADYKEKYEQLNGQYKVLLEYYNDLRS